MASTEAELEADYDEGGEGAEELEAMKKQLKQMEEEADKLKKIQSQIDNQIGSPGTQILLLRLVHLHCITPSAKLQVRRGVKMPTRGRSSSET